MVNVHNKPRKTAANLPTIKEIKDEVGGTRVLETVGVNKFFPIKIGSWEGIPGFFDFSNEGLDKCLKNADIEFKKKYDKNPAFEDYRVKIEPREVHVSEVHDIIYKRRQKTVNGEEDPKNPCEDSGVAKTKEDGTPDWASWNNACSTIKVSSSGSCMASFFPGTYSDDGTFNNKESIVSALDNSQACIGYLLDDIPTINAAITKDMQNEKMARGKGTTSKDKIKSTDFKGRIGIEYKIDRKLVDKKGYVCDIIATRVQDHDPAKVLNILGAPVPALKMFAFPRAKMIHEYPSLEVKETNVRDIKDTEGKEITSGLSLNTVNIDKKIAGTWTDVDEWINGEKIIASKAYDELLKSAGFQDIKEGKIKYLGSEGDTNYFCSLKVKPLLKFGDNTYPSFSAIGTGDDDDGYEVYPSKSGIVIAHNNYFTTPEYIKKELIDSCNSFLQRAGEFVITPIDTNEEITFDEMTTLIEQARKNGKMPAISLGPEPEEVVPETIPEPVQELPPPPAPARNPPTRRVTVPAAPPKRTRVASPPKTVTPRPRAKKQATTAPVTPPKRKKVQPSTGTAVAPVKRTRSPPKQKAIQAPVPRVASKTSGAAKTGPISQTDRTAMIALVNTIPTPPVKDRWKTAVNNATTWEDLAPAIATIGKFKKDYLRDSFTKLFT